MQRTDLEADMVGVANSKQGELTEGDVVKVVVVINGQCLGG